MRTWLIAALATALPLAASAQQAPAMLKLELELRAQDVTTLLRVFHQTPMAYDDSAPILLAISQALARLQQQQAAASPAAKPAPAAETPAAAAPEIAPP